MKKSNPLQIQQALDSSSWEDHPIVQWLTQYGRNLLWALLAVAIVILLIYRFSASDNSKTERDYAEAEIAFQNLQDAPTMDSEAQDSLRILKSILQRQPDLHAKYDALIAQELINRGDTNAALEYAKMAITRTQSEDRPFYTDYSQTTLLIGQKEYKDALTRSQDLQNRMQAISEGHESVVLAAFNLWRIALLQKELGLKDEELKTWQEWKQFYQDHRTPLLEQATAAFSMGKVSLFDYISARESALKK